MHPALRRLLEDLAIGAAFVGVWVALIIAAAFIGEVLT